MVADLPAELWREVASHLPPECLRKLCSINRVFFELAMDEKYRDVYFEYSLEFTKLLKELSYPLAAQRVRSLHIWPHMIPRLHAGYSWAGKFEKLFQRIHWAARTKKSYKQVLRIITSLSGVTSLSIGVWGTYRPTASGEFLPIFHAARDTFGHNLRHLALEIRSDDYHHILSPTTTFPKLEALEITFAWTSYTVDTSSDLCDFLGPFVNNHHPTLCFLSLAAPQRRCNFDLSNFLLQLRQFPYLNNFSIFHHFTSIRQSINLGLTHILSLHADQLRELSLRFVGPIQHLTTPTIDELHGQGYFMVQLPKLESLSVWLEPFPEIIRISQYLHQFKSSLTSLTLGYKCLSFHDVKTIVTTFADEDQIRSLTISVKFLSPCLLKLLATTMPSLDTLILSHADSELSSDHSDRSPSPILFQKTVRELADSCVGWKLRKLIANVTWSGYWSPEALDGCERAIRSAIPAIQILKI
ncbi:hypothetical protein FPV67DRAFT_1494253 [Lyophyllum atratum]|nr:hypothetical protein FPV67DRAFT_1494253 [Lyophyllum atratum]